MKYDTTVAAIRAANGLTSEFIRVGDELSIPSTRQPSVTITPSAEEAVVYTVVYGDTLSDLAEQFGVSVQASQSANGLTSEAIQPGQTLVIPQEGSSTVWSTREPSTDTQRFSILDGDLPAAYPRTITEDRSTIHYQPDSLPARDIERITGMVKTSLAHVESTLGVSLQGRFAVYVAGHLFAPPNLPSRGRSFSSQRRFFVPYDCTGTPADRQYILTHEHTHTMTWNTMGRPASVMLHEGVAVYTGLELITDQGYIPVDLFCAAYNQTDQLPRVSQPLSFRGLICDLGTYYAAGSFVKYLIGTYGTGKFAEVYRTGNYSGVYGQGIGSLEKEWIASLMAANHSLPLDRYRLSDFVEAVGRTYETLFAGFNGRPHELEAYKELDEARTALLEGRLDDVGGHLDACKELLGR